MLHAPAEKLLKDKNPVTCSKKQPSFNRSYETPCCSFSKRLSAPSLWQPSSVVRAELVAAACMWRQDAGIKRSRLEDPYISPNKPKARKQEPEKHVEDSGLNRN